MFSDQPSVLAHYLPGAKVRRLMGDPARLEESVRLLNQTGGGALWIVAPAPSHAFRTNPNLSTLNQWMYHYCQLRNSVGVGRIDFRQQYLEIFHCPPVADPELRPEGTQALPSVPDSSARPGLLLQRESVGSSASPLRVKTSR